ncbi:uncharacterized protein LOC132760525 [Ruditapes philippinarum]|uniref:uncharacterized protein LOC132760525 n=1 Tax=Ruditapes philippinarum TaxID=129788 RepID=UPI00295B3374|nr:uncharacterized protein LOC132760525 [Ruditapes philippinarum]
MTNREKDSFLQSMSDKFRMLPDPDHSTYMSLCLSEILYDIGVNEDMVTRTRRAWLLRESLTTVSHRSRGIPESDYIFGSLTEGATTTWLRSDNDFLMFNDNDEVFSDLKYCRQGQLVMEDDSTPPGYCYIREVLGDNPGKSQASLLPHWISLPDSWKSDDGEDYELHGPALRCQGHTTYNAQDYVTADFCKTWPNRAKQWILEEGVGHWSTKDIKSFAEQSGCFLVPVGSKGSKMEKYEYRISTCLAERALMLSLNITQLRCYILLKIIIKSFFKAVVQDVISSYICKTVLFHCIKHTPSVLWKESKLLNCLTLCLSSLQYCVLIGHCPHFIIHDNNLLFGRISPQLRTIFIEITGLISMSCGYALTAILCENLGVRLKKKLNKTKLPLQVERGRIKRIGTLLQNTGKVIHNFYELILYDANYKDDEALPFLYLCVSQLVNIHKMGSRLERLACKCLAKELSSTIGSLLASSNIRSSVSISKASLSWFDASLDSNISSNRLKLASVFYTAGEINKALSIIKDVENRYDINTVEPVCRCTTQSSHPAREGFDKAAEHYNENGMKYAVAYCVNFLRCERTCMPRELHLEVHRTTAAEQNLRHLKNQWLDLAFVDSLTFLLFLKYKIFSCLGKEAEQSKALDALIKAIRFEPNLGHRETGLNLVGQIMVEKGKLHKALLFFLASHIIKPRINAAKIHICTVISKLVKLNTTPVY